jgi:hypothetical protein
MFKYCDQFNIDKLELVTHSCWVERSTINENDFVDIKIDDTDILLNSICDVNNLIHYRIIYFLKNPNPKFGFTVVNGDKKLTFTGEENCLYVVPSTPSDNYYCYTSFPTDTEDQFILMFNWYLHPKESLELPAWTFPNKYNFYFVKFFSESTL